MHAIDVQVLLWFNSLVGRSHGLDLFLNWFSNYSPLLFGLYFLAYFVRRNGNAVEMRNTVLMAGLSGVVALVVTELVGLVVFRARPFTVLPPDQLHLLFPHSADSSFPSHHEMGSIAFAVGMWLAPSKSARWLFVVTAVLVGISRIIAGVHWPSDIVGSFILGGVVAYGVMKLRRPLQPALDAVLRLYSNIETRLGAKPNAVRKEQA